MAQEKEKEKEKCKWMIQATGWSPRALTVRG